MNEVIAADIVAPASEETDVLQQWLAAAQKAGLEVEVMGAGLVDDGENVYRITVRDGQVVAVPHPYDWWAHMDGTMSPEEQAAWDARTARQKEREAARSADRTRQWPGLHEVADGGTVEDGDTIDLPEAAWQHMDDIRWDVSPLELVEALAERAGGLANRLLAGVQSFLNRRDGNTDVHVTVDDGGGRGVLTITAWSAGGCWGPRAWWLTAAFYVDTDEYAEVRLAPVWGARLAVHGNNGGVTVFEDSEHGPLPQLINRWYQGWEARRVIRDRLGASQPDAPEQALPMEEFLSTVI